ncbi:hypothetical protein AVXHC19_32230 [Acidovorax sacchari]
MTVEPISTLLALAGSAPDVVNEPDTLFVDTKFAQLLAGDVVQFV